jgi:hypothetical protein
MRFGAAVIVALGITIFAQGYCALQSGNIIAPTPQHGPMSAGQAMVIGAVFCVYGAAWALILVRRKK